MSHPASHPVELLRRALAADPSRPLVTFYDDAADEHFEFSAKTFDNWVAKTANLLVDGLAAEPGGRVALALPAHWQNAVWLFAAWSAGMTVVPIGDGPIPGDADIVAAGPDRLSDAMASGADVVGLSLNSLGAPLAECPPTVTDYAVEVRAYGDSFVPEDQETPDVPAVDFGGELREGARLVADAAALGFAPGSRVLTTVSFATADDLLAGLLAPLVSGGSVIICKNLDESALERRISQERATSVVRSGSIHSTR